MVGCGVADVPEILSTFDRSILYISLFFGKPLKNYHWAWYQSVYIEMVDIRVSNYWTFRVVKSTKNGIKGNCALGMRQHRRSAVQWPTILERSMPGPRRLYKRSRLPRYGAFVERPSLSSDAVDIRRPPPHRGTSRNLHRLLNPSLFFFSWSSKATGQYQSWKCRRVGHRCGARQYTVSFPIIFFPLIFWLDLSVVSIWNLRLSLLWMNYIRCLEQSRLFDEYLQLRCITTTMLIIHNK